jgi:hypothetical protein
MSSTNDPTHPTHPTPPDAPPADDHGGLGGPPPQEVIARGYEADSYDTRTVLSVPLLVILFFVLAFGTVSTLFYFIAYPKPNPKWNPEAVEQNERPLNERLSENYRGPKNGSGQPRLEPLVLRSGNARAMTQPALPVSAGNSPEIHPEYLRVNKERYPALYATGGGKLPINEAMELDAKTLEQLFPVRKDGTTPLDSRHVPTAANAGRGAAGSVAQEPGPSKSPATEQAPNPKGGH